MLVRKREIVMEKKKLEEIETLLIVVDMLNGFVKDGSLADPYIKHIIPAQLNLIKEILKENSRIAFIKDSHELGCREFERYPEHCVVGTEEAELIDELKPYEKDALVYLKNSTCAIFAPGFISDIDAMKKLRRIIFAGCELDICDLNLIIPLNNKFDEENRYIEMIVPVDVVETYDTPHHNREEYTEMSYQLLKQAGITFVKTYKGGKKYGTKKIN